MLSTFFFILATLFLSLNFIRPFGLAISDWLYFGALFSTLFETLISKKHNFSIWAPRSSFFWSAMLITLGAVISLANSNNPSIAIVELFQQLYVITVFISLIWIMVRRGKIELIITVFIISGVFSASVAAIDFFMGTHYGPILSGTPQILLWGRYAGTLGHPNKLGYFLVITTILTFYKLFITKGRKNKFGSVIIILMAILVQGFGIYLSGSVTAYMGVLIGLFCLLYIAVPSRIRIIFLVLGFLLVLAALLINMIWINTIFNQPLGIPESSLIGKGISRVLNITAGERVDLYQLSIDYIVQSPIIGAGYDQISTSGISQGARQLPGTIHNSLLEIWYVGGLFAFLGWLIVHIYILKIALGNIFRQSKGQFILSIALSTAVIATLLMDQFQNSIYLREKWLVIGLLAGLNWKDKA